MLDSVRFVENQEIVLKENALSVIVFGHTAQQRKEKRVIQNDDIGLQNHLHGGSSAGDPSPSGGGLDAVDFRGKVQIDPELPCSLGESNDQVAIERLEGMRTTMDNRNVGTRARSHVCELE